MHALDDIQNPERKFHDSNNFFQFAYQVFSFISHLLFVQKSINVYAFTQSLYLSYLQLINDSKINLINKLLAKVKVIYHINFMLYFNIFVFRLIIYSLCI